jgi:ankyrin repeat protein
LWVKKRHFKKHGSALQAVAVHRIVQILIDNGADVNARNEDFGTVIEATMHDNQEEIIA